MSVTTVKMWRYEDTDTKTPVGTHWVAVCSITLKRWKGCNCIYLDIPQPRMSRRNLTPVSSPQKDKYGDRYLSLLQQESCSLSPAPAPPIPSVCPAPTRSTPAGSYPAGLEITGKSTLTWSRYPGLTMCSSPETINWTIGEIKNNLKNFELMQKWTENNLRAATWLDNIDFYLIFWNFCLKIGVKPNFFDNW